MSHPHICQMSEFKKSKKTHFLGSFSLRRRDGYICELGGCSVAYFMCGASQTHTYTCTRGQGIGGKPRRCSIADLDYMSVHYAIISIYLNVYYLLLITSMYLMCMNCEIRVCGGCTRNLYILFTFVYLIVTPLSTTQTPSISVWRAPRVAWRAPSQWWRIACARAARRRSRASGTRASQTEASYWGRGG